MPVALEMALLLLLFGGFWVQVVSKESLVNMMHSFKSDISTMPITSDPKEANSTGSLVSNPPSSTTFTTSDVTHPQTFTGASTGPPVPEPTTSHEVSTENENTTFDSLDTSNTSKETSGPPVTIATSSLEPSNETSGPPVTMTSSSLEPSNETSGLPFTMSSISMSTSSPQKSGSNGMVLVPVLVALLVVIVLLALLLLWRRRQKRRTGVLMLNTGGKRNGVVDAWAGPARVPDEEATTTPGGGAGGNKDSRVLETEVSGQRPLLTTFFSRRKSRQGSLVLEELKSGSGSNTKGEEEPLVGSEDEAVEAPTSNGPEVGDGVARSSL
uniref:Sialophorin n=1 Tax=Spermophilus dauricus TaxID=99837 RepID=A0A8C9UP41_SPEDA